MNALARWHRHANAVRPPRWMRDWLTDEGSLTTKLTARGSDFQVRRLRQRCGHCLTDECGAIGLPRRVQVRERDVLLVVGGRAVVFAHTVVPPGSNASDWPFFSTLGNRSLGSTLFADPLVRRGPLHYARLSSQHPLVRRARDAGVADESPCVWYARRSLFRRRQGIMLVTEVFLPALAGIAAAERGGKQWSGSGAICQGSDRDHQENERE